MIKRIINYEIGTEYKGRRINSFLREKGYPERILTLLRKKEGNLLINGTPVHMNYILHKNNSHELLTVVISEEESSHTFESSNIPPDIVYEDEDLLVVNKPAGMPVHPSLNHRENTLANSVTGYFTEKNEPFVFRCINRLDKDTTGLTILAKHYLSAGILSQSMQNREIKREYTAIAEGCFERAFGTIDYPIGRSSDSLITRKIDPERGEPAVTHYKVVEYNEKLNLSVVMLTIDTGRTHQIRVHMRAIGHPLVGDYLYNPANKMLPRQALHAGHIEFTHPITGERLSFTQPLPEDMKQLLY